MAILGAASDRTAGAINHFFPEIDPFLANAYIRGRVELPSWFKNLWYKMKITGAYGVFQGFYPPDLPSPMLRGEGVTDSGFSEFTLTITPHDYKTPRVPLHHNDVRDSNAPVSPETVSEQTMTWLAQYELLVVEEMLLASAATYLHPDTSFTNMFGGSGLYSASHSFNGQTLNNYLAKSGTSVSATLADFWRLVLQRRQMVGAEGIPETLGRDESFVTMTMLYPPEREETINAIGKSELVLQAGATAGTTNYTRDVFRGKWDPHCWEMLSDDNALYAFYINEKDNARPFVLGEKEDMRTQQWNEQNSDWSRFTLMQGQRGIRSFGVALGHPKCTAKVY